VSPPVAVQINFCRYLQLLCNGFFLNNIHYINAIENLSGQQLVLISRASGNIQPTLDFCPSEKQKHAISATALVSREKCGIEMC
jgi:hypothetical protein